MKPPALDFTNAPLWVAFNELSRLPAYEYLRRHFDFGATVVVLNTGATSAGLTDALTQAVFGRDALDAYARFLAGR
ncbi:MAG TPA: hypothetical protein VGA41_09270 [Candidatus Dormibacteraeota bacterium]